VLDTSHQLATARIKENAFMIGIPTLIARFALPALLTAALVGGAPHTASAAETISEQDAHAIGVQAYLYFYSLVTMDLTRKQLTNLAKPEGLYGPMNTFANILEYPTADTKVVVRPNFDTLYSSAWLDLTKEPAIVSVPDTHGRYYCCRCSTCGPMSSRPQAGAQPEPKPAIMP
jgi:hypothetical protein